MIKSFKDAYIDKGKHNNRNDTKINITILRIITTITNNSARIQIAVIYRQLKQFYKES